MPTDDDGALLPVPKKKRKKRAQPKRRPARPEAERREFPILLAPPPAATALVPLRKAKKKSKPKIVTFKCPSELLAAVDTCVVALRAIDPMASRATVLRMALTTFLEPRGFLGQVRR